MEKMKASIVVPCYAEQDTSKRCRGLWNALLESREITDFITTPVDSPTIQLPLGFRGRMTTDKIGFQRKAWHRQSVLPGAKSPHIIRGLRKRRRLAPIPEIANPSVVISEVGGATKLTR